MADRTIRPETSMEELQMSGAQQIVVFFLDEQRYGIPLGVVERVVRMVAVTRLPGGPEFILGIINVQGTLMPVLDLRGRFGLPRRPLELCDQLIITRFTDRCYALVADAVSGVRSCQVSEVAEAEAILPDLPFLVGVAKLPDGMILINAPEKLLTPIELQALDQAVLQEPS